MIFTDEVSDLNVNAKSDEDSDGIDNLINHVCAWGTKRKPQN